MTTQTLTTRFEADLSQWEADMGRAARIARENMTSVFISLARLKLPDVIGCRHRDIPVETLGTEHGIDVAEVLSWCSENGIFRISAEPDDFKIRWFLPDESSAVLFKLRWS
jgi:hypothetical protein